MTKNCQRCGNPREKGSFYITTKLVESTIRLTGLKLCKDCSNGLSTVVWDLVFSYLQKKDGEYITIKET